MTHSCECYSCGNEWECQNGLPKECPECGGNHIEVDEPPSERRARLRDQAEEHRWESNTGR